MSLKSRIQDDVKAAMRAGDKARLGTLRMLWSAIRQKEVDDRVELDEDDAEVVRVVEKLIKQRRDSLSQYREAGRDELADREQAEIAVLETYLPEQLGEDELAAVVDEAVREAGAESMKDMGRVMGLLKPHVQGSADMGRVSALVKARLSG